MTYNLIIPRDPLIFRDGRPFTADPGSQARSLPFPYPSTVVGALRHRAGVDPATGIFDTNRIAEVLNHYLRGPILVELDDQDMVKDVLLPAPGDALLMNTENGVGAMRYWQRPLKMPLNAEADFTQFAIVGVAGIIKGKPYPYQPAFWRLSSYLQWLETPLDGPVELDQLGINKLPTESRVHVSIIPDKQTALPGALFQTSALEFTQAESEVGTFNLSATRRLGILLETDAVLSDGLGLLGGEHRVASWKDIRKNNPLPNCPASIREKIKRSKACRVILLTPAYFEHGFFPTKVLENQGLNLQAVLVHRYQTVSGWDYEKGGPKPTRRLAPSGSVYYLKFDDELSDAKLDAFIASVWLRNISDDEQSKADGFGLAILGTWDGNLREMEVEK
ncbi:MAG: CRISPR-associated protein Cmr3 [Chloroflexi bacterium HGW-Chloroflexi-6]|nr:MAG: CRISPR-associated protein Cmr3 [Chloroflexi bacterium HGW-Chloroflexi-6]